MGKKLSLVGVALVGFLGPLEYSVVMPSLWFYLKEFGNESQIFYSVVLSSFSFAHMCSSPLVGWLADKRSMKELLALGMLVSAVGHVIYALAWDEWGVLLGRFVAGLGAANYTLISVYVARITTVDDRTTVTARLNIFTEMGLLLGPAFAILFEQIDFALGPFEVNKYTAPGYLMLIMCLLLMVYLLLFFENPGPSTTPLSPTDPALAAPINAHENDSEIQGEGQDETSALLRAKGSNTTTRETAAEAETAATTPTTTTRGTLSRILTRGTITVLFAQFILFFNQTAMEAILAPLTEEFFGFTPFENSLIFVGITVVFLLMYLLISLISHRVQDRTLIAIGLATESVSLLLSMLLFVFLEAPPFWLFALVTSLFVVGLPFFFCCTSSLITKLVEERDVGLTSGFLSSAMQLANIAGPLWGGSFSIEPWLPFAGELGVVCLLIVFFTFSFKSLYIPKASKPPAALTT